MRLASTVLFLILAATAAIADEHDTDFDPQADFTSYKTFTDP
jgi:hypothetical protein